MRRSFLFALIFLLWASPGFSKLTFPNKPIDDFETFVKTYDSKRCMECHEDIYNEWKESFHSRSMVSSIKGIANFFTVGVPKEWEKPLNKQEILKCLDCHLPQIKYATERLALEIAGYMIDAKTAKGAKKEKAIAKLKQLNITCYGCHNIKAAGTAPGITGHIDPNIIFTGGEGDSDAHETEHAPIFKRSFFCTQCHGVYISPDGESTMCNTLSGSYVHNYIGQGGRETCQDCHMKKKNRGHRMPGGHDLEIVKEGIEFQAEIKGFRYGIGKWIPAGNVEVFLTNKAGHRIPDG
ncbi:hypothetical protein G4V39_01135 [Thermosulfuriphilus ammonigenes]|uniref:Cytochrome c-552/4 domain-containing protein n=2 Tax=Thermosulfuriphilus ammonigenes TaxID=1936021 RepID=A0A6G7PTW5_9BACT|nr:nitrate reductase cytochrome c-type subunit [Thermosulfuriphilus ammonigenes]QIJ70961.1 hypothetical protein G4V39_01135 [Thermosulfuriphilus ammonigenes]